MTQSRLEYFKFLKISISYGIFHIFLRGFVNLICFMFLGCILTALIAIICIAITLALFLLCYACLKISPILKRHLKGVRKGRKSENHNENETKPLKTNKMKNGNVLNEITSTEPPDQNLDPPLGNPISIEELNR